MYDIDLLGPYRKSHIFRVHKKKDAVLCRLFTKLYFKPSGTVKLHTNRLTIFHFGHNL